MISICFLRRVLYCAINCCDACYFCDACHIASQMVATMHVESFLMLMAIVDDTTSECSSLIDKQLVAIYLY
jgi:hypothetical protein